MTYSVSLRIPRKRDHFPIRKNSIEIPKMYLGADTKIVRTQSGDEFWCIGANSYMKEAIRIVQERLKENGVQVKGKGRHPYSSISYRPELDMTPFCSEDQIQLYQNLIGMLRWAVELGRIDILLEVSQMSSYMANPRIGHLHQVIHIFHYLKHHMSSWLPMDPMKLDINWSGLDEERPSKRRKIMKTIYRDAIEEIAINSPEPLGNSVQMSAHIDADHARNKVT